jgi:hypothetical protein
VKVLDAEHGSVNLNTIQLQHGGPWWPPCSARADFGGATIRHLAITIPLANATSMQCKYPHHFVICTAHSLLLFDQLLILFGSVILSEERLVPHVMQQSPLDQMLQILTF